MDSYKEGTIVCFFRGEMPSLKCNRHRTLGTGGIIVFCPINMEESCSCLQKNVTKYPSTRKGMENLLTHVFGRAIIIETMSIMNAQKDVPNPQTYDDVLMNHIQFFTNK
jgi:hypothetical protein